MVMTVFISELGLQWLHQQQRGSTGYTGGSSRRSGNSCTNSSRHNNDGCTSSGKRDGNGDGTNSSRRSTTAAAGAPVAGGGARSLHGPCYHIFILFFAVNLHLYLLSGFNVPTKLAQHC